MLTKQFVFRRIMETGHSPVWTFNIYTYSLLGISNFNIITDRLDFI